MPRTALVALDQEQSALIQEGQRRQGLCRMELDVR